MGGGSLVLILFLEDNPVDKSVIMRLG